MVRTKEEYHLSEELELGKERDQILWKPLVWLHLPTTKVELAGTPLQPEAEIQQETLGKVLNPVERDR